MAFALTGHVHCRSLVGGLALFVPLVVKHPPLQLTNEVNDSFYAIDVDVALERVSTLRWAPDCRRDEFHDQARGRRSRLGATEFCPRETQRDSRNRPYVTVVLRPGSTTAPDRH